MKKALIVLVAIAAICITSWQIARSQDKDSAAMSEDESQIIVFEYQWNDKKYQVSLAELKAEIEDLPIYRQQNYESKEGKEEYLQDLIDERLKVLAAASEGFDKDEEFLKKAEDYKHQLMVERITEIEVDEKIVFTEEDLKQYYEEHKTEDYVEDATVRTTCITLEDEDLAQETLDRIKAGEDIIEVAKELSENGKLTGPGANKNDPGSTGFFSKSVSSRWQPFVDEVFAQEIGEVTEDVFEMDLGNDEAYYMIFRKEEYKPERIKEFEEVKNRVERTVERERKRQRISSWVEEITTNGKLKTYLERIPEPPPEEEVEEDKSEEEPETSESKEESETPESDGK